MASPFLTEGTMRAPRATLMGLASTLSTSERSISYVFSSTFLMPLSSIAVRSSLFWALSTLGSGCFGSERGAVLVCP